MTTIISENINNKGLTNALENLTQTILHETVFLETELIAENALWRVARKIAPAQKKSEFKDCAIWETALAVGTKINGHGKKIVFFTVNTDDYIDKSRHIRKPYGTIVSECATYGIELAINFDAARNLLP